MGSDQVACAAGRLADVDGTRFDDVKGKIASAFAKQMLTIGKLLFCSLRRDALHLFMGSRQIKGGSLQRDGESVLLCFDDAPCVSHTPIHETPLWPFLLAALALPFILRKISRWLVRTVYCATCRYDLTGNASGTCPECGTVIAPRTKTEVTG